MDEQEHMARLLRKKSKIIIAHGTCACYGGIVGLRTFSAGKNVSMGYSKRYQVSTTRTR